MSRAMLSARLKSHDNSLRLAMTVGNFYRELTISIMRSIDLLSAGCWGPT
jgi:hypothetical protein